MDYMTSMVMGSQSGHSIQLAEMLNKQREEQSELCDVTISLNGKEIKAHWCVLVSCPFFESMYSSGLTEKNTGKVNLSSGNSLTLEKVVDFMYKGQINMSMDNIADILELAEYLQISSLRILCDNFLQRRYMDPKHCVKICLLGTQYSLQVQNNVETYIRGNLRQLMSEDDGMMQLSTDSILFFLKDETLSYVTGDEFLDFIFKWVKFDKEGRKCYLKDLLETFPMEKISSIQLEKYCNDSELADIVTDPNISREIERRKQLSIHVEERNKTMKDVILLAGGKTEYGSENDKIYAFILDEGKWSKVCTLPREIKKPLIGFDGKNKIYVLDSNGKDYCYRSETVFQFYEFNTETRKWNIEKISLGDDYLLYADDTVHAIDLLIGSGKIFIVLLGISSLDGTIGWMKSCYTVIRLVEVKSNGTYEMHNALRCQSKYTTFKACLVDDESVGFLFDLPVDAKSKQQIAKGTKCKIAFYNFMSKTLFTPANGNPFFGCSVENCCVFANDGVMVQLDVKSGNGRTYSLNKKSWGSLPKIDNTTIMCRLNAKHLFLSNQLYVFGGNNGIIESSLNKYVYDKKTWEKLTDMPVSAKNSGVCVAKIPTQLLCCHAYCPHCRYNRGYQNKDYYWIDYVDHRDDYDSWY